MTDVNHAPPGHHGSATLSAVSPTMQASMPDPVTLRCPYCGESFTTTVDASAGSSEYIEDCVVCCRPIVISMAVDGDAVSVCAARDDD